MAIVTVTETYKGDRGWSDPIHGNKEASRTFFVVSSIMNELKTTVELAADPVTGLRVPPVGDPPPVKDTARIRLTVTRNEALLPRNFLTNYVLHVNQDTFYGFPPGTVRLSGLDPRYVREDARKFWRCPYQFDIIPYNPNDPVQ